MLFCLTGGKMPSRRCKFALCVGKVPWRNKWQSTLIACLGNPIGRRASGATVHGVTTESDRLETKQQIIVQFCVSFCCTIMWISQVCLCVKSSQSCPIFCNPTDCSLPGSSVQGSLQARPLEWVVMHFSRGSSRSRDRTRVSYVPCISRLVLDH